MVWGYLALVVVILGGIGYFGKVMYDKGYRKGQDEADNVWKKKYLAAYSRVSDRTDDGIRVSDGNVWSGAAPDPEKRVESSAKSDDPQWGSH